MSLPGFIGEASLYRTAGYYQRATAGLSSGAVVVPATCSQDYCTACINGWQTCCEAGGYPHKVSCDDGCRTTCGPCVPGPCNTQTCTRGPGSRTCTDCHGTKSTKSC
jgi:hypothetical protein